MKQLLYLLVCLAVTFACSDSKNKAGIKTYKADTAITGRLSGKVVYAGQEEHNYYDIAITDNYYAFMDYYSDTLLQVRNKTDFSLYQFELREKDTFSIAYPAFTKYDYVSKNKADAITIWDNELNRLKRIDLSKTEASPLVSVHSTSITENGWSSNSTNCCITSKDLYAVSFNPRKPQVFYSSDKKNGEYAVPAYPKITVPLPNDVKQKAYASDLVVNEEKGVIVAALRFIDCINFYNLNCDMTGSVSFADYYSIPIADITNKHLDAERSKKCFIDICCSDRYIFCLFDGTADFTSKSIIYVFDWDGKQKAVLQADRNLRKIATEKNGKYLLALSPNQQGGRDVIMYSLNKF